MAETQQHSINLDRFLTLSVNMLDNYFFRSAKEKARKLFKEIEGGKSVRVGSLTVGDDRNTSLSIRLTLDAMDFQGHLTFHQFRTALQMMLREIAERLRTRGDLRMFTSQNPDDMLFFLPGIVEEKGQVNMLVLGLATGETGSVRVNLKFLDPAQFRKGREATTTSNAAPAASQTTGTPPVDSDGT